MDQAIQFIGKICSDLKRIEECPLQENENAPQAEIIIFPEFIEGVPGTLLPARKSCY